MIEAMERFHERMVTGIHLYEKEDRDPTLFTSSMDATIAV
jgi:hypothetical protein